ncbi:hypothetical protein E4P41_10035 [Geodermatophilus sp. DF01-2]|uniref:hypothetical protein n=1 Tax=Geodermatophilus sp. DF01-2 TaxID=2559610 RepID=UPI0010747C87|nr:hypothetical protein [Geodermatophilus sp. DF01_2]TFV61245.1 hypothetical protein E4P41_10035 [Geodermatophilus sp. DF01_2]
MMGSLARGLVAGAVGTTALDAASYLDMVFRGRPASSVPDRLVDAVADRLGLDLPGRGQERANRRTAWGALVGIGNGLATGVAASVMRSAGVRFSPPVGAVVAGAAAMAATDVPAALLGVSDPRSWSTADWATDAVSHLAYGAGVQAVLETVPTARERRTSRNPAGAGLALRSLLLGVASGSRGTLGLAAPALTTRRGVSAFTKATRASLVVAEMAGDKHPATPTRTTASGMAPRFLGATTGAARLAVRERANGAVPVLAAALGTAAGSWGGLGWRRWAAGRMPDWQAGLIEDAVALVLAASACLPGRDRVPLVAVPR